MKKVKINDNKTELLIKELKLKQFEIILKSLKHAEKRRNKPFKNIAEVYCYTFKEIVYAVEVIKLQKMILQLKRNQHQAGGLISKKEEIVIRNVNKITPPVPPPPPSPRHVDSTTPK